MTETSPRFCVIIPVYQHAEPLKNVVRQLETYGLPCYLVDDGNEVPLQNALAADLSGWPSVSVLRLAAHSGKGAACVEGGRAARARGFTHAVFIDADGQHDAADIPGVLALARQHPEAMILGNPLFDQSAPRSRRYGRFVSNAWAWIETLSFEIKDSLCGFRCFPLDPFLKVAAAPFSRRMDYDPDVAVRLFWEGVPAVNFDTRIRYPSSGVSNFNMKLDNAALVRLHTRLFFGMLVRSPFLISRHWRQA